MHDMHAVHIYIKEMYTAKIIFRTKDYFHNNLCIFTCVNLLDCTVKIADKGKRSSFPSIFWPVVEDGKPTCEHIAMVTVTNVQMFL